MDFINKECCSALYADLLNAREVSGSVVDGVQEVTSFLRIMSALCDKNLVNEETGEAGVDPDAPSTGKPQALIFTMIMMIILRFGLLLVVFMMIYASLIENK